MGNPWTRREQLERTAKAGAPYVHADWPEWTLYVRPANRFNSDWATHAERLRKLPEFAALADRERADGYVQTAGDKAIADQFHLDLFAAAGVAGWTVTDRKGKPLPLSPANVLAVFEAFPEIAAGAMAFSATPSNFAVPSKDDKLAAVEGN